MLSNEIREKYFRILNKGNTLKLSALDAIDMVENYDELKKVDQIGTELHSDVFKKQMEGCQDKIIMKLFTLYGKEDNKSILYWCPCSLHDIIGLAGASNYDEEKGIYQDSTWVFRKEQLSFLGKDIKKSCANVGTNKLIDEFVSKYINTDHPIADNIFYTIYLKTTKTPDGDEQTICCARNIMLSPRPDKNKKKES